MGNSLIPGTHRLSTRALLDPVDVWNAVCHSLSLLRIVRNVFLIIVHLLCVVRGNSTLCMSSEFSPVLCFQIPLPEFGILFLSHPIVLLEFPFWLRNFYSEFLNYFHTILVILTYIPTDRIYSHDLSYLSLNTPLPISRMQTAGKWKYANEISVKTTFKLTRRIHVKAPGIIFRSTILSDSMDLPLKS